MSIVEQKIKEGKAKFGVCEWKTCNNKNDQLLFKITTAFVCGECVDMIGKRMEELGMLK